MARFYSWTDGKFQRTKTLMEALKLEKVPKKRTKCLVISLTGAGGKTSTMFQLAHEYAQTGKRVIVTTSTHIWKPEGFPVILTDRENWIERLKQVETISISNGWIAVVAGREDTVTGKLKGMMPQKIARLMKYCDVLLIEADGSKGLPLKIPAWYEPVIIPETQVVIGCAGMKAIGERIQECCFRWEQVNTAWLKEQAEVVSERQMAEILCSEKGTRKGVGVRSFRIVLNQIDGEKERREAEKVAVWVKRMEKSRMKVVAGSCYSVLSESGKPENSDLGKGAIL